MIQLADKVAVVTGGSRGIGAATVELLAEAGAQVVFSYHRQRAAALEVARGARRSGVEAVAVRADLSRVADARRLIRTAVRRFRRVDILVANAGIWNAEDIPIEKLSERDWDRMLEVNLKSVYAVVRFAVPVMKRQGGGRIIALSSTAGQRGEAFHDHYAASKGAVISFVKGLSTELAPHGILVNCVAPGWVDTDMARPVLRQARKRRWVERQIPLGRVARAKEIAGPILFLASELATFMTGEIVNVNGGSVLVG
ncbi:MAG: glucose 1-dehydrogenase [Acidobacteria bacterium]|nr:glucose 1-dehydrogenase [Acidobacteriota bacterium]